MIHDGYTRAATISGVTYFYRPATYHEHKLHHYECSLLASEVDRGLFMAEYVASHLVRPQHQAKELRSVYCPQETFRQLFLTIEGVIPDKSGKRWVDQQWELEENLRQGIRLIHESPQVATRSCESCKKWWYNEVTGRILVDGNGKQIERDGPTMCQTDEGCPKGTPEKSKGLCKENQWAWLHYQECVATRSFPDDAIVRKNARIIRNVLDQINRQKDAERHRGMVDAVAASVRKNVSNKSLDRMVRGVPI